MAPVTRSAVKQRATAARTRAYDAPGRAANGDAGSLHWSGGGSGDDDDGDGYDSGLGAQSGGGKRAGGGKHGGGTSDLTLHDWANMALLVLLYAMQGIPLGLTMGTMPFLLQARLSFTQMGVFAVSSYPYSLKLLWSPVVDSVYSAAFGRRKSWIVPIQLISAALLVASGPWIEARAAAGDVPRLTALFFCFVLLCATQDIAVDGWALELLPPAHLEYASTCQTLGMNVGYFTSFTVFLAAANADFCNKYVRAPLGLPRSDDALVTLGGYVIFWGWAFAAVTLLIAVFKRERPPAPSAPAPIERKRAKQPRRRRRGSGSGGSGGGSDSSGVWAEVGRAYLQLWRVVRLRPVWGLSLLLVTYRLGVLPAESAASLKLLDKGVAREALAALVLLQFPVELASAVVAGRWAAARSPYHPFMAGYYVRLAAAAAATALAAAFPANAASLAGVHAPWFAALAALGLVTAFTSTLMFTALGSFFNRVSDPAMGGAYLTLLNTIANVGVILPKTPLFALIDALTVTSCRSNTGSGAALALPAGLSCPKKARDAAKGAAAAACAAAGGRCVVDRDGFYYVSFGMVMVGVALGALIARVFPRLTALPVESWRAGGDRDGGGGGGGGDDGDRERGNGRAAGRHEY